MAKTRIYELARALDIESKVALDAAKDLGYEVKTASSGLEDDQVAAVKRALGLDETSAPAATEPQPQPEPTPVPDPMPDPAPVPVPEPEPEPEPDTEAESPSAADDSDEPGEEVGIAEVYDGMSVSDFAEAIDQPSSEIVKVLLTRGTAAGAGHPMPVELMEEVAEGFGVIVDLLDEAPEVPVAATEDMPEFDEREEDLVARPPVVTVMGHVDHGKTTLLDTIRKAKVVDGEAGGITQHIGAYQVEVNDRRITFIDTPGHEAFTTMRARGADVTDIVVLVVAADDGVMPQTVEAINHAKAAGVELVIAVNKMDVTGADPLRVRTELTQHGVIVEELGGDVPSVEVSALNGDGVDNLLEVLDLIAQLQEYKANPKPSAMGVVIESQLEQGMGPTATVIIKRGTLKPSDAFVAGPVSGRARAMMNEHGDRLKSAGPSDPVLITGWSEVPTAGTVFEVVKNDKVARNLAAEREQSLKDVEQAQPSARERLQGLLEQLRGEETELRVVLKADAHGSLEALRDSLAKIKREDGRIDIVHGAVGGITENDVTLAEVTGGVIVGFNVRPEGKARRSAEEQGIQIFTYSIIYELLDEIELMLVGKLEPDKQEVVLGEAEVRALFKVPRAGTIAGSYVTDGVIIRGAKARLLRAGVVVHDGVVGSLRRFKDDAREVNAGFECGISLEGYNDIKEGDVIETYEIREVART